MPLADKPSLPDNQFLKKPDKAYIFIITLLDITAVIGYNYT